MGIRPVAEQQGQGFGILGVKDGSSAVTVLDIDGGVSLLPLQGIQHKDDRLQAA